ncbi:MAG: DEAD/DEAH box helicase [Candidatus Dormibacteraeota bacterium]|nr:DEAD/DEAH box helicase [Candidatus Dormibacteraeota bacterium]
MTSFAELGLEPRILDALTRTNIETPVLVQAEAIPPLLDGDDVVIEAPTGSGKTLAFLIPAAQGLLTSTGQGPRVLVVTPTRELAVQIDAVWKGLETGLRSALLYGGVGYATQSNDLKKGPDIIIGTPGRILDMVGKRLVTLSRVEYLVLDEADEMLDAGFAPDVEKIMGMTYQPQTVLASATMPEWVSRMIQKHLQQPIRIKVMGEAIALLEHGLLRVDRGDKLQVLNRLLRRHKGSAIVFGRTKHGVKKLNRDLKALGHDSVELQGNLSQGARDKTMESFRDQKADILVATNVAARGLDISHVGLVINFELPDTAQWMTHRIGRTARMGNEGRALTMVTPEDMPNWSKLRRQGAPELPELDSEHLLSEGGWRYVARNGGHPAGAERPASAAAVAAVTAPRRRRRSRGRGRPSAA